MTRRRAPKSSVSSSRRWQRISTGDHSRGAGRVRAPASSRPASRVSSTAGSRASSSRASRRSVSLTGSRHDLAAVDVEGGAVDEGRGVRGEKDDRLRDLTGLAQAPDGDGLGHAPRLLGCPRLEHALGRRGPGRHRVDGDAVAADLEGQVTREPDRKSTRLNSSHLVISYVVLFLKKKKK